MENQIANIGQYTLGGGLALIGVGFILQQIRFWKQGPGRTAQGVVDALVGRLEKVEGDLQKIFSELTTQGKGLAEMKGALEVFMTTHKGR